MRKIKHTPGAAGPDEKDRVLLQEFQVVVAEFKRLDERYVSSRFPCSRDTSVARGRLTVPSIVRA